METVELFRFVLGALTGHRLRSALSALGVAIGVAAVVLLTSLGEGTRRYIVSQFTQFGTNLMASTPGRSRRSASRARSGERPTSSPSTMPRRCGASPGVEQVVPVVVGQARVEAEARGRSVFVYGVTHELPAAWRVGVAQGSFLPEMDPHRQGAFAVLGPKLARELFGGESPARAAGAHRRAGRSSSSASWSPRASCSASTSTTARTSRWPPRWTSSTRAS